MIDITKHNRFAWNRQCSLSNPATIKYSPDIIEDAKRGQLELSLSGRRKIPKGWYEPLAGRRVLCLALAGGQQVPLIAAAGAIVVSIDNSPVQLNSDRYTADCHGLNVDTVLGDMREISKLVKGTFDMAFLGLGVQFIPDPKSVWEGVAEVLGRGNRFIGAFVNPVQYLFQWPDYSNGEFIVRYPLPYSDLDSMTTDERNKTFDPKDPLEFGHTLEQILGGLTSVGFSIDGFIEDHSPDDPFSQYMASYYIFNAFKQ
jgi:hypothetical protein